MVTAGRLDPPRVSPEADERIVLTNIRWSEYEIMLAMRGERSRPRMHYLKGNLELMSPSRTHEEIKTLMARLLEAYALHAGIVFEGYGSMTMRNAPKERGAEPDECYAVGKSKDTPDLAIEVIWTSGGLDKLDIYAGLGVAEVWIWEENRIAIHALRGDRYHPIAKSRFLPEVDLELIAELIARGGTQTAAVRAFVDSLRNVEPKAKAKRSPRRKS